MKYYIIAGEASGDLYGSKLIDEIGDVCAMIQLLKEKKHVTQKEIDKRMKVKFKNGRHCLNLQSL